MQAAEIAAIVNGRHGDPFRILGPQPVARDWQPDAWEIRAFLPQAERVEVLIGGASAPMESLHPAGLFTARFDARPDAYRYRIHLPDGVILEEADPYRFPPLLTEFQLHLHGEGTHYESYNTLGAHLSECNGVAGVRFAVWAPNAEVVSVVGDFNGWDPRRNPMRLRDGGLWEMFLPHLGEGAIYKYNILTRDGRSFMKADPYAFAAELPPKTGSVVACLDRYQWRDRAWMEARAHKDPLHEPISVYEVHLGSWLRSEGNRVLTYPELAAKLPLYAKEMGYTHIELMPVQEHPYSGSWGYQVTGHFAPTSRYGSPQDFMTFVDACHQAGIGVLLDWVPAHFPKDAHGLAEFDGTALYEHEDPRKGEHIDWGTKIFNYGRNEVRSFLISSAVFWLKKYHIDGLRVDAVASMLYLDYSREEGQWIPNLYGGNENLEAIDFLKKFNEQVHQIPGAISIAEESTSFPGVSHPVYANGLGFTFKWNMGWMHDMLDYFSKDPIFRKYHHNDLTFSMLYAFSENYVLPISHDEVVHGKRSLLGKMPGDEWQRFANVRAFLAFMWGHPGKKLLFMGAEIGQYEEWNYDASLRWDLLQYDYHLKLQRFAQALNRLYLSSPELYEVDHKWPGFEWIDFHDVESSVISFLRWSRDHHRCLVFVCNFTPQPRYGYRIGVPSPGVYLEVLNTDEADFGGSNAGNLGHVTAEALPSHGRPARISIVLPPLAVVVFRKKAEPKEPKVDG